ncbi:cytochrome P450 2B1-like [Sceloporus undulatus]|uniref:cytochrome P450 2B1-like n=1 Tax=Sceloporus undulatus TaxID=8520 RepID=UPI001C4BA40F|nr:cytochrome P450 2B1-like [Sceloporus undulatus]
MKRVLIVLTNPWVQCSLLFSGCHLSGVILTNGKRWIQMRRFSLTTMRNFGMGKKGIEERIQEETEYLVKELRATNSQPFIPATLFSSATGNVISHILFGERFDYQDKDFVRILRLLTDSLRLESSFAGQVRKRRRKKMLILGGRHHG